MQKMNIFNTEERFETLAEMEMMDIQGGEIDRNTNIIDVIKNYFSDIWRNNNSK